MVQAEVRAENEMVEEFVREQMGISAIAKVKKKTQRTHACAHTSLEWVSIQ